jgi:hypothetical protein
VVPTTFTPRDVPLSDGSGTVKNLLAATCDCCGSVVALPAQSAPAIAASLDPLQAPGNLQDREKRGSDALHKRIMSLLDVTDAQEGIRIVQEFERVDSVRGGRDALIAYLSGQTLVQIGNDRGTSYTMARSVLLRAAHELSGEIKGLRFRSSLPSTFDDSILSRLSVRSVNSLRAMGLGSDEKVIIYLKACGTDAFKGIGGIGRMTRSEILEAYGGLF